VRAVNAVGNGPASVAGTVTPGVAPSAATGLTAVSGNGSATLSFTPGDDGGSAVTGYEVSTDGGATWATLATAAGAGGTRTGTVTGLTNGTTYSVTVRAVNVHGFSPASSGASVTPAAVVPAAPSGLTATPGNGSAAVAFTPGDDGGSAVTGYEVSTDGGATWATLATAAGAGGTRTGTVTGLTNGTTYSIAVRTVNGVGNSPASDTASVTPAPVVPAAPSGFTATPGDGSVALSFVPADDGGSAVTTYQASTDGGATWTTVTTFPRPNGTRTATITGLTNGSTYAVSVRAVNAVGNGAPAPTRSVTLGPIPVKYAQLGGAASFLGALVGAEYDTPGGRGQNYERGAIYWSPATGAWSIHGYILRHYLQLGGPAGLLGYPTSDESSTGDQLGRVSTFAGAGSAAMYWTPATGAWAVHGKILTHYRGLGGPTGPLAYPVTDETGTPDHVGRFNHFTGSGGASVYWTPGTGAWSVHGAIRDHWAALGYERGVLGYPTSDESGTPDHIGRYNTFTGGEGGSIYWTPGTGAWSVHGAIRDRWAALGYERGVLGYPTSDESGTPDKRGRYNTFTGGQGGSIYWTPGTGAWSVHGAIRDRWAALGYERGRLGYPTSDEYAVPGGRRNTFTGGTLTYSYATRTAR